MPLAISVVGRSKSGKTTLLENLVRELKGRGYNLATIKHSFHDFDLDHPGKDSWRLAKAGSDTVVLSSPQKLALIKPVHRDATLEELLHLIGKSFDLVLVEGLKNSSLPKIEVHRKGLGDLVCSPEELFAVVTDERLDIAVPQFSPGEIGPLVDLVEQKSIAWRESDETVLVVNDAPQALDHLAESVIHKTLLEMVSALTGVEEVRSLQISLRRGQD